MGSNRFYLSIVLYCLLIGIAAFLFFFFLNSRQQPSTAAGIAVVSILLLIRLIYFVNRSNRILSSFLVYMQEKDPSLKYTVRYVDKNFRGLHENLEKLIREFKENRLNLEVQAHYLEAILDNVSTGIITFDHSGKIRTMNRAAGVCLGFSFLEHLDDIDKHQPGLGTRILALGPDEQFIETIQSGGKITHLSINSSRIKLKNETIHIVALNDISNQMEEQEIRSWKKLIRVMNHEIMNSMTPIITLSQAIRRKLAKGRSIKPVASLSKEVLEDAVRSASIIGERSKGLVSFIERYKKLTGLPPLQLEIFPVSDLMARVEQLFKEELASREIRLIIQTDCPVKLKADKPMLEQVIINLVKNSAEALSEVKNPVIEISCYIDPDQHICLSIRDNGKGISPDKLEQVFVPFFTTRENGSGIGLSLCKQIIQLHKGRIFMESKPGTGTEVIIKL